VHQPAAHQLSPSADAAPRLCALRPTRPLSSTATRRLRSPAFLRTRAPMRARPLTTPCLAPLPPPTSPPQPQPPQLQPQARHPLGSLHRAHWRRRSRREAARRHRRRAWAHPWGRRCHRCCRHHRPVGARRRKWIGRAAGKRCHKWIVMQAWMVVETNGKREYGQAQTSEQRTNVGTKSRSVYSGVAAFGWNGTSGSRKQKFAQVDFLGQSNLRQAKKSSTNHTSASRYDLLILVRWPHWAKVGSAGRNI